jgi:hypothetical protein
MPLSVFRELVDGVANFVRSTLTPTSLLGSGRDHMFFDVEIGAPEFASLLIPIKAATLDEAGLKEFWRSQDLSPEELRIESEVRGQVLWQSLVRTSAIAQKGALELDDISENHTLLRDLAALVPSEGNEIERLEVTYRSKDRTEIVILTRKLAIVYSRLKKISKILL